VPTIETGASVVHTYVDEHVDLNKAAEVIFNEKIRRVSVCNALDTLLVNKNIAQKFLHLLAEKLKNHSPVVELRADQVSVKFLKSHYPANKLKAVREKDYATEFLDYVMNIKVVKNIDEAIAHIRKYSLKHSEAILTDNKRHAEKFQREVDAACVYVNTSTCFSDGAEFGLGAEVGISTQKMHARGPMGLRELTSYKWLIDSNYQIRL
ncbi:MAG: aldehyde dehydrogenase family protein, partial [bacterium]|nr:aldehyde dehydrogenase family protein [bacterium]